MTRLLPKNQSSELDQLTTEIIQEKAVRELTLETQERIAEIKGTNTEKKQELEKELSDFAIGLAKKKGALLAEVKDLENKRKEALIPIVHYRIELDEKALQLAKSEKVLVLAEKQMKEAVDILAGERLEVEQKSSELAKKDFLLSDISKTVEKKAQELAKSILKFTESSNAKEKEVLLRIKEARALEYDIKSREHHLQVGVKEVKKQKQKLSLLEVHLEDRERTLKKAFDEAREKNLLSKN